MLIYEIGCNGLINNTLQPYLFIVPISDYASSTAACAAAKRAIGTLKGEHDA